MEIPNFYEEPKRTDGRECNPSIESLPSRSSIAMVPEEILKLGYVQSLNYEARIISGGEVYAYDAKNDSIRTIGSHKSGALQVCAGVSIDNIRDSFNNHIRTFSKLLKELEAALDPLMPEQHAIINCQKFCLGQYVLQSPAGQVSLRTLLKLRNNDGCAVTYLESYGFAYSFGNVALTELIGELVPNPTFYARTRYSYKAFTEELSVLSTHGSSVGLHFHTRPSLYSYIKSELLRHSGALSEEFEITSITPISIEDQLCGDNHLIEIAEGRLQSKFERHNGKETNRFIIDTNAGMFFCRLELNLASGLVSNEYKKIRSQS